ncbi:MAG: signal peptidase II [Candidatus Methylomirabilis sp.]
MILLDQVSKLYIQATIPLGHSVPVIPDLFAIVHVLNPGAAFGLLAARSASFRNPFFIGISILAIAFILYYRHRGLETHPLASFALSLILGGALGNLIDRLRIRMVIDFLDVHYYQYHWPAFNVADSAITIGVSLMLLDLILGERRRADQRSGT